MKNSPSDAMAFDIDARVQNMRADGDQFAIATVVRTISVTAAKPGAKAVINSAGEIVDGWIGGGCARSAVIKAAMQSLSDGEPKLLSLKPEEFLNEEGLVAGEETEGVIAARNMCPSQGSMDIFIEPILCEPELLILGASPVARMLVSLTKPFAFNVKCACDASAKITDIDCDVTDFDAIKQQHDHRYIVVATQGSGDAIALKKALSLQSMSISFVGSKRKTQQVKIPLDRETVFQALNDLDILKQSIPGCEELTQVTEQELEALVVVKFGPMKASFNSNVEIDPSEGPGVFKLSGKGDAGVAGFANGGADVILNEEADGTTLLSYTVNMDISGKLAQVGGRLIEGTSKRLAKKFFTNFEKALLERQA